jgi:hypothetical protein
MTLQSIPKAWLFVLALICSSCSNDPSKPACKAKPLNPNGDSELALLMREMFADGLRIKGQLERDEPPTGLRKFTSIHSAIPTDSTVKTAEYTAFANAYLEAARQLEAQDSLSVFRFNTMVDQCMNCHTAFCPGPKKRIKKLYIAP